MLARVNLLGFYAIVRQDHMRQPAGALDALALSAPLAQILNGLAVVGVAAAVMLFSTLELDIWVWSYAFATVRGCLCPLSPALPSLRMSPFAVLSDDEEFVHCQGIALVWSGTGEEGAAGRGFPSTNFYPAGLVVT